MVQWLHGLNNLTIDCLELFGLLKTKDKINFFINLIKITHFPRFRDFKKNYFNR